MKIAGYCFPESAVIKKSMNSRVKTYRIQRHYCRDGFEKNYPEVTMVKFDSRADAYNALLTVAETRAPTDNTEVCMGEILTPAFVV